MQRPDSILPVKEGILRMINSPKKGLYYVVGIDKERKPFLWLKATDFTQEEERALKAGAAPGYQEGRVFYNPAKARPVFCAEKPPTQSFSQWMVALCREAGSEKLKTATYVKVPTSKFSAVLSQGVDCGVEDEPEGGISDEVAEGVGQMMAQANEEAERRLAVEASLRSQGELATRLKEAAARLRGQPDFGDAVRAASEAGALLRGKAPNVEAARNLLIRAALLFRKAEKDALEASEVPPVEPTDTGVGGAPLDEDEGEDIEEDDQNPTAVASGQGYSAATGQYGGRPNKPKGLSGKDENGEALTAHHIYPWNKLRSGLNAALLDKKGEAMKKILAFAVHTPPPKFYEELAKDPGARHDDFVQWVNAAARALCWGPSNIFMGPLNTNRGDDPGSKLDAAYSKSGLMTPASAVGELLEKSGGIAKASPLTELLARNVREASIDEKGERTATGYDPLEWELDQNGKKVRRGRVELSQEVVTVQDEGEDVEVVQLRSPEDPNWDPTVKEPVGASLKGPMSPEEILQAQQSDEAVEKRRLREAKTKVVEEDYGPMGLFDKE